jgi:tRNA 2-thiouridine synthesizing protein A
VKIIDARGLQSPEPFERVVDELSELVLGDRLKLIINQVPRPLYRFLERNRYAYSAESFADGRFEIVIWELPAG